MPTATYRILSPVTAIQVSGTNMQEVATFCSGTVSTPSGDVASVLVPTSRGKEQANIGDYVLQKGTLFGVAPQYIFEAIYQ